MNENNSETISLHKAILDNDFEKVQCLIKEDADINLTDNKGLRPLHAAIMTNNIRLVELLINIKNIEVDAYAWQLAIMLDNHLMLYLLKRKFTFNELRNVKNSQGETLVHYSVRYRCIKLLNECIAYCLNVNGTDIYGYSPLHLAIINNDTKIVKFLLKSGADVYAKTLDGRGSIHFAVKYQCFETLLLLVDSNVDVNDAITTNGLYPLHIAVENNDERTVNLLIRAGGDIHCKDKDGKNLLHVAVENEYENMVNMLLKKGVDINARFGEKEESVIELALIGKNSQIISAILNDNPDLNSKNKDGLNALFVAIEYRSLKATKEIFALKPDFSAVTNDNCSLLHYALIHEVEYIVNYFLENNININVIDNEGKTALHYAALYSDETVMSQLINKNLDVNARTIKKLTPLHFAVTRNCAVVQVLLNNGADINAEDINRRTPLFYSLNTDFAESKYTFCTFRELLRNSTKIVTFLLGKGANINVFDNDGNSPLYYLLSNHYLACDLKELILSSIKFGASINKISNFNDNILHVYLKYGCQVGIVQIFLDNGGNINQANNSNQTPLEVFLEFGKINALPICEFLINKGAIMTKNKMAENALHLAVKRDNSSAVRFLLERKFTDLNDATIDGSTALHYAIKYKLYWQQYILHKLLAYKVDVNARDSEGKTPLHLAVIKDSMDMVNPLLSNNADVNATDIFENSPLCYAISNKNLSMIKLLLNNGACTSDRHCGKTIYDLAEQTGDKHVYHMVMFFFKND